MGWGPFPIPCLTAQPAPLTSCAPPTATTTTKGLKVYTRPRHGQVQQAAVSSMASPTPALHVAASPVSSHSAAARPAAATPPASAGTPRNRVASSDSVLTPAQQRFMNQVTKKIGAVMPVPRVNRRPKGPASRIIPQCNRRLAGSSAERRQLGQRKGS
jgi:hypothetical protein